MRARLTVEALSPCVAPLEGRCGHLRLDFNENTIGPSPKLVEAIRSLPAELYAAYPENEELTVRYARHVSVLPEQVGLLNGSDAAFKAVIEALGEPGQRFVTGCHAVPPAA